MSKCVCGQELSPSWKKCPVCERPIDQPSGQAGGGNIQDSVIMRSTIGQSSVGSINVSTGPQVILCKCNNPITGKNPSLECEVCEAKFCLACETQFRRGIPRQPGEPVLCKTHYKEQKQKQDLAQASTASAPSPAYAQPALVIQVTPQPFPSTAQGELVTSNIGTVMRLIPIGEFMMGDQEGKDSTPLHRVSITRPFYLGIYQVTQGEWQKVMGSNPSEHKGDDLPVEQVSWQDCQDFLAKLNRLEPLAGYRLPTEAEWEYACRAASTQRFNFGDNPRLLIEYGWFDANAANMTHTVGKKRPNAWGLYDMHGNVWEWCSDWYDENYYSRSRGALDPKGPVSGTEHVVRGGSWHVGAVRCTSGFRGSRLPDHRGPALGLRLARSV